MGAAASSLLHERGLKADLANAVDAAVDVVAAVDEADVLHLDPDLHDPGRSLDLRVHDLRHGIAVLQRVAVGVAEDAALGRGGLEGQGRPRMPSLTTSPEVGVETGKGRWALRTGGTGQGGPAREPTRADDIGRMTAGPA